MRNAVAVAAVAVRLEVAVGAVAVEAVEEAPGW
jgi:hypothetical protein